MRHTKTGKVAATLYTAATDMSAGLGATSITHVGYQLQQCWVQARGAVQQGRLAACNDLSVPLTL
jgi:hypothetical protein